MAQPTYNAGQKKKNLSWEVRLSHFLQKEVQAAKKQWRSRRLCQVCMCLQCLQPHVLTTPTATCFLLHHGRLTSHLYKSLPVSCPVTENLHFTKIQKGEESSRTIPRCTAAPAPLLCCRRSPLVCLRCLLAGKDQLYKAVRGSTRACWLAGSLAAPLRSGRGVSANFQRLLWLVYD